jgi:hypothetical protein
MGSYKRRPTTRRGRRIRVAELHAQGLSLREIAKIVGVKSHGTVINDLRALGVVVNFPGQKVAPQGEILTRELTAPNVLSLSAERFARRQA